VSRYRFIATEQAHHAVARLCRVLQVAPSGYYAWRHRQPSVRSRADASLAERIQAIYARSGGTYGAPRIHAELRETHHIRCGRKRVARLMRSAHLAGRAPRRFVRTTLPNGSVPTEDLVQRQFVAAAPNQLWLVDITYVRTWEGWLYLAIVLDAFSRTVVGWALADQLRTDLATAALQMALITRRPLPGLIHHGDRGSQYLSAAYRAVLTEHGVRQSVGRPGTCWDNAVAESFFATLKQEVIYRQPWPTRQAAERAIFAFIAGWYNPHRRHSTLGYCSPAEVERRFRSATLTA
jgi:transposase InsO family protein